MREDERDDRRARRPVRAHAVARGEQRLHRERPDGERRARRRGGEQHVALEVVAGEPEHGRERGDGERRGAGAADRSARRRGRARRARVIAPPRASSLPQREVHDRALVVEVDHAPDEHGLEAARHRRRATWMLGSPNCGTVGGVSIR